MRGRRALAIAKPTQMLLTMPEHDQPDHEGLFPMSKRRTSKKLRLQSRYCEYKMKTLLIKVGSVMSWFGRWTQTKYEKLQLWRTFNLKKTQSLNDALRVVYMEEEGEFHGPWRRVPKPTLTLVSPHIRTLKTTYNQVFRNYMGLAQ